MLFNRLSDESEDSTCLSDNQSKLLPSLLTPAYQTMRNFSDELPYYLNLSTLSPSQLRLSKISQIPTLILFQIQVRSFSSQMLTSSSHSLLTKTIKMREQAWEFNISLNLALKLFPGKDLLLILRDMSS